MLTMKDNLNMSKYDLFKQVKKEKKRLKKLCGLKKQHYETKMSREKVEKENC